MMRFAVCGIALVFLVSCGDGGGGQESGAEAPSQAASEQPAATPPAATETRETASLAPVQDDAFCAEYISDAMISEHCGRDLTTQSGLTRGNRCERKVISDGKVLFTATFIRSEPETWDGDRRHFPAEPIFEPHKQGEGGRLRFAVYPHLVALSSNNPTPPCDEQQLRALGTAIAAKLPADEPAPATLAIAGCSDLLPAQEVEKACGRAIAVKSSGMADGDLNLCNHSADGLVFLLSRHRDPSTAQKAAAVAGDGAAVADGSVHLVSSEAGPRAVAPVRNLLVELKSSDGLGVPNPPCTADQLETLAEGVVARLQ